MYILIILLHENVQQTKEGLSYVNLLISQCGECGLTSSIPPANV